MSGTLAVRPASQPSRPFGRPEALRAVAALVFAAGLGALTLPPVDTPARPNPNAAPVIETWMQVAIVAIALATGCMLWQRSRWYARHLGDSAPGRSRTLYALITVLIGLAVAGLIPLRRLAAEGRVPTDVGAPPAVMLLLLTAFGLVILGASELRPRRRYRHTGLHPQADEPSRRTVSTEPPEVLDMVAGASPDKHFLSPLELACQSVPHPAHAVGYMWNTATVRSPCASVIIPAVLNSVSRRSVRRPVGSSTFRWILLALLLLTVLALLFNVMAHSHYMPMTLD